MKSGSIFGLAASVSRNSWQGDQVHGNDACLAVTIIDATNANELSAKFVAFA